MFHFFGKKEIMESVGIDIGTSSVKVVQLRKEKEKIILVTYGEIALGPYAGFEVGQAVRLGDEKLVEAIQDLFREAKITCKNATLSLDPAFSYVAMVSVPKVSNDELRTMVPIEARKYLPVPVSEVQLDWWHIPDIGYEANNDTRSTSVVLAAVKNETIEMYGRVIKKLNLEDVEFEIEGFSLSRSSLTGNNGVVLCLDIGAQYSTVSLVKSHVVIDMNVINHGSQEATVQLSKALSLDIKTAEETKRTFGYVGDKANPFVQEVMELASYPLFGELTRLSLNYERKYNQVIDGVIVSGGGSRLDGMLDVYKKISKTEARLATPFDQVEVPVFLKEMVGRIGPSYAIAVGLALKKLIG